MRVVGMASENKVVLIGDPEVGKTTIFTRFKTGQFSENVESQTRKEADCKKERHGGRKRSCGKYKIKRCLIM